MTRPAPHHHDAGVRSFLGMGRMATLADIDYDTLLRWRHCGPVWVPSPDIQIGRWPGWSQPCVEHWIAVDHQPFRRPECRRFADTAEMRRECRINWVTLWLCIGDGTIPAPVVWVDGRPGWRR
ncbi:hypothetical protein AB4305_16800 [Nocardia sp. 2YAB30]|uniref:hypothetical protein n=1 Tax=unclassified Nocardia TaxID=2637762 RepID=UPI003F97143D